MKLESIIRHEIKQNLESMGYILKNNISLHELILVSEKVLPDAYNELGKILIKSLNIYENQKIKRIAI